MTNHIRVARSFVASDALASVIAKEYDLGGDVSCKLFSKLVRTQDNDHYLVTANGSSYVARVYQCGEPLDRTESDYQFELAWLTFLKDKNMPVSYPIARKDGGFLGSVVAPEGLRYYALFTIAKGEAMSLNNMEQLFQYGIKMAQIHEVSNQFETEHKRFSMDLDYLLDDSIMRIQQSWGDDRAEELEILLTSAAEARIELEELLSPDMGGNAWGVIGGDWHQGSVFFDGNDPTFFNFDLCGHGWRAYDIATFLSNSALVRSDTDLAEAFFAGYYSVRQLAAEEHAAISPFLTVRRIWVMGTFAREDGIAGHTFIAPA